VDRDEKVFVAVLVAIDVAVGAAAIYLGMPRPGLIVAFVNAAMACVFVLGATINISRIRRR